MPTSIRLADKSPSSCDAIFLLVFQHRDSPLPPWPPRPIPAVFGRTSPPPRQHHRRQAKQLSLALQPAYPKSHRTAVQRPAILSLVRLDCIPRI
ncbi:hypothetical protein C8034_v002553 [Colletotrichum sidae]|uniref:Uncharacterized protein n=1 Tax=Colletotrichum sidae TaxID=1347389 RepID=A0A4R8TR25_9PEZI|nr:hypothetical protein C8034_v002553 [Colletotrichum sidae]